MKASQSSFSNLKSASFSAEFTAITFLHFYFKKKKK